MTKKNIFFISSPIGFLEISLEGDKLYSIQRSTVKRHFSKPHSVFARKVKKQLEEYFNSKRDRFSIPLVKRGTEFQRQVWKALQKIPYSQTRTYKEVSLQLGFETKSRPVGQACSKNPFLIVVPCHRVLAQKNLGGFALGLKAKKNLLNLEDQCIIS